MDRLDRLDDIIGQLEQSLVAILLSLMIGLAFLQILLRNVFSTGLSWGDPLVRYMVLWVGFIGASIATKDGKHISIDVISRWVSGPGRILIQAVTYLSSALVCGLLNVAAVRFITNEAQIGGVTFLGIPTWIPGLVIPVAFGLMSLRFVLRFLKVFAMNVPFGSSPESRTEA